LIRVSRARLGLFGLLLCTVQTLTGCGGGGGPSVVIADQLDPDSVGRRALELYDSDKNGRIDATELKQSPALASAMDRVDKDKDGAVSADEIAERIRQLQEQSDLVPLSLTVERDRAPVSGATVVFEPDEFLGEGHVTFQGVSDASGAVSLASQAEDLPGLPLGFYRVRVSGPVDAVVGCEVAEDGPTGTRMTLSL
jgi:hypothetical protein